MMGFNPCSRGCSARRFEENGVRHILPSFNPCSRGCSARSALIGPGRSRGGVSILVLVDVPLEDYIE